MIVVTLPISPNIDRVFQVLFTPFVASIVSKYFDVKFLIAFNQRGSRNRNTSGVEKETRRTEYLKRLKILGVEPSYVWEDSGTDYEKFVEEKIKILFEKGIISSKEVTILQCECGNLEGTENSFSSCSKMSRKVLSVNSGRYCCKICNCFVESKNINGLFLNESKIEIAKPTTYQDWISNDLKTFNQKLDKNLYISRERNFNPSIIVGGVKFYLDIDFYNSFYLSYLADIYKEEKFLIVTTSQTIQKSFFCCLTTHAISPEISIEILGIPTITWLSKLKPLPPSIDEFLDRYASWKCRWFLALGFAWKRKEIAIDSQNLFHIKDLRPIEVENITLSKEKSISDFLSSINHIEIKSLLSKGSSENGIYTLIQKAT